MLVFKFRRRKGVLVRLPSSSSLHGVVLVDALAILVAVAEVGTSKRSDSEEIPGSVVRILHVVEKRGEKKKKGAV